MTWAGKLDSYIDGKDGLTWAGLQHGLKGWTATRTGKLDYHMGWKALL